MEQLDELKKYMQTSEYLDDNEKNLQLMELYPWLQPRDIYGNLIKVQEMIDEGHVWTAWIDFPLGWRKAFGWDMLQELAAVITEDQLINFSILQIKEKFGGLRFYAAGSNDRTHDIIIKYMDKSERTCIDCGKPAKWRSTGWIMPFCDECKNKFENETGSLFTDIGQFREIKQ